MKDDFVLRHNPGRREAIVAVAIACLLVLGAFAVNRLGSDPDSATPSSQPPPAQADDRSNAHSVLNIDTSDEVTAAQIRACAGTGRAWRPDNVTVRYGVVQQTAIGTKPAIVLANKAGELRLCDSFGPDNPARLPVPEATASDPVAFLSNGRTAFDCDATRVAAVTRTYWLSVAPVVDRVQTRFVVDGVSSPWFSATAQDGIAHVQAWLGQQDAGVHISTQTQVIDKNGAVVAQTALPTGVRPLEGCNGHDVNVG